MKIAVIDLGTNTFNLLIVEKDNIGGYKKLSSNRIPVKLGEGTINKGFIADIPFKRGITALKEYSKIIKEQKIETVVALATSAIRTAKNGLDFVAKAKSEAGIDVEVIDGNREAELIYFGNRQAVKMDNNLSLIMDIGGGSTEFIIATKDTILWKQSFMLGAARLLELFNPSDPISDIESKKLNNYFDEQLKPLMEACKNNPPCNPSSASSTSYFSNSRISLIRSSPAATAKGISKRVKTAGCTSPKNPPGRTAARPLMKSFSSYGLSCNCLPISLSAASMVAFASVKPARSLQITNATRCSSSGVHTGPISKMSCGYSFERLCASASRSPGISC